MEYRKPVATAKPQPQTSFVMAVRNYEARPDRPHRITSTKARLKRGYQLGRTLDCRTGCNRSGGSRNRHRKGGSKSEGELT